VGCIVVLGDTSGTRHRLLTHPGCGVRPYLRVGNVAWCGLFIRVLVLLDVGSGQSQAVVLVTPYPRSVSNPCRFCGATNRQITNEHVWPDWLRNYLPTFTGLTDIERYSPGTKRQRLPQPFLTTTVRAFCDSCNSGWMADIEAAAEPIVGPMVIGLAMDLDADAQRVVANWVALKGLVAAQVSKIDRWIPESHYRRVHNSQGGPPDTMRVWVGRRRNLADAPTGRVHIFDFHFMPVTNHVGQFPIPPDVERYRQEGGVFNGTIFQVGHFFALAFQQIGPACGRIRSLGLRRSTHCRKFGLSARPFTGHRPRPLTISETCTR
jgi:hypothetical protein